MSKITSFPLVLQHSGSKFILSQDFFKSLGSMLNFANVEELTEYNEVINLAVSQYRPKSAIARHEYRETKDNLLFYVELMQQLIVDLQKPADLLFNLSDNSRKEDSNVN